MRRLFVCVVMYIGLLANSAWAGGIAVVDFQKAINEVKEGKKAKAELDKMFASKKAQLAKMEKGLKAKFQEYQSQQSFLAPAARQEKEQALMMEQQKLQQMAMQSEAEVQQTYAKKMEGLIKKMKGISSELGKQKNLDLILEVSQGGVVYKAAGINDLTANIIQLYDSRYGG